jgi:lysophospholipase L1-like esterase
VSVRWVVEPSAVGVVPSDLSRGVALVGDSLAVGLTPQLTQELSDYDFRAASKGGTDIKAWLTGFMSSNLNQILAGKPAVVLVSLGTNDTAPASQPKPEIIRSRVLELVKRVRDAGSEPVWLFPGTLPWSYESVRAAVKESGSSSIEQPAEVAAFKKYDPVHPSGEGYKVWARAIAEKLKTARPSAGVSRGGGLLGGVLIVAAAAGLLWATLRVSGSSKLLENRSLPRWYQRPRWVHHIEFGTWQDAEKWTGGWTIFRRCDYGYSYFVEAMTLDELERRIRRGLPRLPRDCWYAVGPTDRDWTSVP